MLISRNREKLINAVVYFSSDTRHCGKVKLFKTKPLIGFTHEDRGPWDKIWDSGKGNNERIPYALAVPDSDPNRDAILGSAREYEGIAAAAPYGH